MTVAAKDEEESIQQVVGGDTIQFEASDFAPPSQENSAQVPPHKMMNNEKSLKKDFVKEGRPQPKAPPKEKSNKENIVPFPKKGGSALEAIGIHSAATIQEEEAKRKQEEEWDKPTETEFVLIERDRLRGSEEKLTKQSGLELYRKSTNMKLFSVSYKDENGNDKTKMQSPYGILVNKKQA